MADGLLFFLQVGEQQRLPGDGQVGDLQVRLGLCTCTLGFSVNIGFITQNHVVAEVGIIRAVNKIGEKLTPIG